MGCDGDLGGAARTEDGSERWMGPRRAELRGVVMGRQARWSPGSRGAQPVSQNQLAIGRTGGIGSHSSFELHGKLHQSGSSRSAVSDQDD